MKQNNLKRKVGFLEVSKLVFFYIKKFPAKVFFITLFIILGSGISAMNPIIIGELTDFLNDNYLFLNDVSKISEIVSGAYLNIFILMFLGIFYWIQFHWSKFLIIKLINSCVKNIKDDLFDKVQKFDLEWHKNSFSGSIVSKIKRSGDAFANFILLFTNSFIPIFFLIIFSIFIFYQKLPLFGLITLIFLISYISFSSYFFTTKVMDKNNKWIKKDDKASGILGDSIYGNFFVKSFGMESYEKNRFEKYTESVKIASDDYFKIGEIGNIIQNIILTSYKFSILFLSIYFWLKGVLTIGEVLFALTAYNYISSNIRKIGYEIKMLFDAIGALSDAVLFIKKENEIREKKCAKNLNLSKGEIEFKNILFKYKEKKAYLFENFSLKIKSGEKVAIIGTSGSGKSSFVNLLKRFYDIAGGEILIDGQNIKNVKVKSLRENITLVPQDSTLFHRTIFKNISYGKINASEDDVKSASKKAYANDFIKNLENKYETMVGERGVKLSGGERQRISIARAILANKKILVLDEATSALDNESEHLIQKSIENLIKGKTVIMIAHRLSTIKKVDRILVFKKGKIIEEGSHSVLLKKKDGEYKKLYDLQNNGFIGE